MRREVAIGRAIGREGRAEPRVAVEPRMRAILQPPPVARTTADSARFWVCSPRRIVSGIRPPLTRRSVALTPYQIEPPAAGNPVPQEFAPREVTP